MSLWADYAQFHEAQTQSRDMDPAYPVLKWFADSISGVQQGQEKHTYQIGKTEKSKRKKIEGW